MKVSPTHLFWSDTWGCAHFTFLVIEHLPQELRDRFTDMREMDLGIHSKLGLMLSSFAYTIEQRL